MCMKYVNVNIQCFDNSASQYWFGERGLSSLIGSVESKVETSDQGEKKYVIGKFSIAIFINIRGSKTDKNNNPLERKQKLEFKIRLTKLEKNPEERLSYDLASFSVDLSNKDITQEACFKYVELIKLINVNDLALETDGDYVIKALVKKADEDLYDIQMVHPIEVTSPKQS